MTSSLVIVIPVAACVICALLVLLLRPLLQRYALARPNARSSHSIPTPQGGGAAVIAATTAAVGLSALILGTAPEPGLFAVFAAVIILAVVGAFDDLRPIAVLPRLVLQAATVSIVLATLPAEFQLIPFIPLWAERALLLIGGLWFVNLVNFMDGLDWMTVAEIVPITAALALLGLSGQLPAGPTIVALALGGAMIGFAPFNRPVAKLFLGDVGSLPIGLLVGWCLLQLVGNGHLVAALLLPLYYLADATITLLRRLANGEAVWTAHRSHFYQRATGNGFSVLRIVTEVLALNLVLAVLAAFSIALKAPYVEATTLAIGAGCVALVLNRFSLPRKSAS